MLKLFTTQMLGKKTAFSQQPPKNIVLISGILSTSDIWKNQVAALSGRDMIAHYVDTLNANTPKEIAREHLSVLPQDIMIVAHSLGCCIALEMAQLAPERVKGLILVNGTASAPSDMEKRKKHGTIKKYRTCTQDEFVAMISSKFFSNQTFLPLTQEQESLLIKMATDVGPANFIRQLNISLVRGDLSHVFKLMPKHVPIKIVHSISDKTILNPGWRALISQETLKDHSIKLIEVPDAGHLIPIEKPNLLTDLIQDMTLTTRTFLNDGSSDTNLPKLGNML